MLDISNLPSGLFKTFLNIWVMFRNTYFSIYSVLGQTTVLFFDGTVLDVLLGVGLFVVLVRWCLRFVNPFS